MTSLRWIYIRWWGSWSAASWCRRYGLAGDVRRGMSQFRPADVGGKKTRGSAVEECRLARAEHTQQQVARQVCDEAIRTFPSRLPRHAPPHAVPRAQPSSESRHQERCTVDPSSATNRNIHFPWNIARAIANSRAPTRAAIHLLRRLRPEAPARETDCHLHSRSTCTVSTTRHATRELSRSSPTQTRVDHIVTRRQ